ncbi:MAG TPA: NAD(P)-dependent oxidoreductase [Gaiellaceae bacterium]|nr:NAD(P)-dependent oxidoreductase [Gaiellaceae bacterium]
MRVFLAGGTGAIGRRLVPLLAMQGHEVTATTRIAAKADLLHELGATPVVVDGLDAAAMREAVSSARPDVVVHQLTALAGVSDLRRFDDAFAATNLLRTRGTDILLEAALGAGASRFVAQSYTGWPNAREGGPVKDEADPLDQTPPASMRRTLAAIRHLEAAVTTADGLDGVVLRYGGLYGPGTSIAEDGEHAVLVRKRRFPIVGDGAGIWSFVHVDDAARATVAAIEGPAAGVFNVVDDKPAPVSEWLPILAEALGAAAPRRVPVWVGRLAAGEAVVSMMTSVRGSSNAKAKRELGWRPLWASWRDGFRRGLSVRGAWEAIAA